MQEAAEVVLRAFPRTAHDLVEAEVLGACARGNERELREDNDEDEGEEDEDDTGEDAEQSAVHGGGMTGIST